MGRELDVEAEEPYFLLKADENGEEIYRVPLPDFAETVQVGGSNGGVFQIMEQDRETVRRMVDCAVWNQGASQSIVSALIFSEVDWFFEGEKTAAEVADIIQNRVQLYLSEGQV